MFRKIMDPGSLFGLAWNPNKDSVACPASRRFRASQDGGSPKKAGCGLEMAAVFRFLGFARLTLTPGAASELIILLGLFLLSVLGFVTTGQPLGQNGKRGSHQGGGFSGLEGRKWQLLCLVFRGSLLPFFNKQKPTIPKRVPFFHQCH